MSQKLLTETHCARLLVVILGSDFGYDFDSHKCCARVDLMTGNMDIKATVAGQTFEGRLDADDLEMPIEHCRDKLAAQLQSQVFAAWKLPQSVEPRQYPASV